MPDSGARVVLMPGNSHLILIRITPCMSSYCLLILNTENCHIPAGICDSCLGNLPGALLFAACVSTCKKTDSTWKPILEWRWLQNARALSRVSEQLLAESLRLNFSALPWITIFLAKGWESLCVLNCSERMVDFSLQVQCALPT